MSSTLTANNHRDDVKNFDDPVIPQGDDEASVESISRRSSSSSIPLPRLGDDEPNNDTTQQEKEVTVDPSDNNIISQALNGNHEKRETTEEEDPKDDSAALPPAGADGGPRLEEHQEKNNGADASAGRNKLKPNKEENSNTAPDLPNNTNNNKAATSADGDNDNESGGGASKKNAYPATTGNNNKDNDRTKGQEQEEGGSPSNRNRDETASPSMHEIIPSHITFTNGGSNTKSPPPPRLPTSPRSSKKLRKAPAGLDESTFRSVKEYLTSDSKPLCKHLNDDEVVQFMIRLYHLSNRQAQYQRHLFTAADSDDDNNSEYDDNATTILFYEILADEQEHALGHELYKTMIADINKKKEQQQGTSTTGAAAAAAASSPSSHGEDLDPRTLNWIKKAAGMNRSSASQARRNALQQAKLSAAAAMNAASGEGGGEGNSVNPTRRMVAMKTRTAARQSREQKRQRGLNFLNDALDDIEKEFGPFAHRKKKQKSKEPLKTATAQQNQQQQQSQQQDHQQKQQSSSSSSRRRQRVAGDDELGNGSTKRQKKLPRLVATIRRKQFVPPTDWVESTKDVILSSILIDGHELIKRDDSTSSRLKVDRANKNKSKTKRPASRKKKPRTGVEAAPCLRTFGWERSRLSKSFPNENQRYDDVEVDAKADVEFLRIADKNLPLSYKKAGITCHIPDWDAFNHPPSNAALLIPLTQQSQRLHSDATYASFCSKLMKAINGPARSWATCEFFYSDLDREWYNRNTFIEEVAKLGVDPDTKLSHREWKAIRRRIVKKPRRFSKRFIASQLNERNEYRSRVRMLQHVPALAYTADFPYNIPAPIRVGTTVTAYSKRFRMIQRGIILSRDELNAMYLVLFENKAFGCEYCPDSEVASHGGPEKMVKVFGAESYLSSVYDQGVASFSTSYGFTEDCGPSTHVSVRSKLEKALQFFPLTSKNWPIQGGGRSEKVSGRSSLFENIKNETAEREMLVVLLKTADAATRRKEALLSAIEKVTYRLEEYQSSKETPRGTLLSELKDQYAWLWANLEETDKTLNLSLRYMRLMYGDSPFCDKKFATESDESKLVEAALSSVLIPESPVPEAASNWAVQLACGAEDVSARLVKIMAAENNVKKKKDQQVEISATVKGRLRAVGQLLLSASCGQGMASAPSGNDHVPPTAALAPGVNKLLTVPEMPIARVDATKSTDLQLELNATRDLAVQDLKEAIKLLHTECAVLSARHKLDQ